MISSLLSLCPAVGDLEILKAENLEYFYKVGPLPVINGVITPISRVITPVTH